VIRSVGEDHEPRPFSTWAPKAVAIIGKLQPTLADRAIIIPMRRKLPTEKVERLRPGHMEGFNELQRHCIRWAEDHIEQLREMDPSIPDALHDRAADNWRPLCAIAEIAGGDWVHRGQAAIKALSCNDATEGSPSGQLLEDIREMFQKKKCEKIFSNNLLAELCDLELRPWCDWYRGDPITARQVAKLLAPFGIRPKTFGLDHGIGHFMLFEVDSEARAPAPPMPKSPQTSSAASDRKSALQLLSRQTG
jgi:hypothetical protein